MKTYIKPEIDVVIIENTIIAASYGGCDCGCYSRDYHQSNAGCCGCPHCDHDNSDVHICESKSDFLDFSDDSY